MSRLSLSKITTLVTITGLACLVLIASRGAIGRPDHPAIPPDTTVTSADRLDFSTLALTFNEDFDSLDISAWGPGTRWIAHTPWGGDFGAAAFTDPDPSFPFSIDDGVLRIEAARDAAGNWRSGLIASVDVQGQGFAQHTGYFEMRARLPLGAGVWPAFWLIGKDRNTATAEIDVLEFYGDRPEGYSSVVHVWHRDGRHDTAFERIEVFADRRPTDWHSYGVQVDDDWLRFYFDRLLVWKTPTLPEHRQPLYILINLALVNGDSHIRAPDPSFMYVDYVRAYAPKGE